MGLDEAVRLLLWLFIFALIFGGAWWAIGYFAPPEPLAKFLRGAVIVLGVLVLVYALLTMIGTPSLPRLR